MLQEKEIGLDKERTKKKDLVRPHNLHILVILSSEELVAPVCSDHIFIHGELDFPPELAVLFWAHRQSKE